MGRGPQRVCQHGPRFARHEARGGTNHERHTDHQAFVIGAVSRFM